MGLLKDEDLPRQAADGSSKKSASWKVIKVASTKKPGDDILRQTVSADLPATPLLERTGGSTGKVEAEAVRIASAGKKPVFGQLKQRETTEKDQGASGNGNGKNSGKKLSDFELAARNAPRIKVPLKYRLKPDGGLLRRATWDVASITSLLVNMVLLGVIIILGNQVKNLKATVNNLVSGLYDNFVALDDSVITTTLNLPEMYIPLDFTLPVVQPSTNVTLTENVTIRNAYVIINTDAIKINSNATVTLPAGTTLPVSLNMNVPVQTTIPVNLSIPVVIKLSESNPAGDQQVGLHDAFLGLQNTVGPFYCLFNPDISNGETTICQQGEYLPRQVNP